MKLILKKGIKRDYSSVEKRMREHVLNIKRKEIESVKKSNREYLNKVECKVIDKVDYYIYSQFKVKKEAEYYFISKLLDGSLVLYKKESIYNKINLGFKMLLEKCVLKDKLLLQAYRVSLKLYENSVKLYDGAKNMYRGLKLAVKKDGIRDLDIERVLKIVEKLSNSMLGIKEIMVLLKSNLMNNCKVEFGILGKREILSKDLDWVVLELVYPLEEYNVEDVYYMLRGLILGGIVEESEYKIECEEYKYIKVFAIKEPVGLGEGVEKVCISEKKIEDYMEKKEVLRLLNESKHMIADTYTYMRYGGKGVMIIEVDTLYNFKKKEEIYMLGDIYEVKSMYVTYIKEILIENKILVE